MRVCFLGVVLVSTGVLSAQRVPVEATGNVAGHVYLSDTGGPARLASVALQPLEVKSEDRPFEERMKDAPFAIYKTELDGGYRISSVRPGSYYVVVKEPGYLSPFAQFTNAQLMHPTAEEQKKIDAYLPVVTVLPNNTTTLDLHLTRGASFSGMVRFDDGSPYPGAHVAVLQKDAAGKWKALTLASGGSSDDLGHYRITGLLEGEYLLSVGLYIDDAFVSSVLGEVNSMSSATHYSLEYYSGDTPRRRDAKVMHLDNSQEMSSADITIPVSKLHAVSGAIVEAKGGRPVNGGTVMLYYTDDDSDAVAEVKVEREEPVFRMPFVPEGVYTIKVKNAVEVSRQDVPNPPGTMPPYQTKETVLRKYGSAELPLTVTADMSGVNLAVSPLAKTP